MANNDFAADLSRLRLGCPSCFCARRRDTHCKLHSIEQSGQRVSDRTTLWAGGDWNACSTISRSARRAASLREHLLNELKTTPGVENVCDDRSSADERQLFTTYLYARVDGNPSPVDSTPARFNTQCFAGIFCAFYNIPLLAGRDFNEHDKSDSPLVVILSNSTAKKLFPNQDPIGPQIFFGVDNGTGLPAEVIGIVGDVRSRQLAKPNEVEFYRPWPQRSFSFFNVLVRTSMKPERCTGDRSRRAR